MHALIYDFANLERSRLAKQRGQPIYPLAGDVQQGEREERRPPTPIFRQSRIDHFQYKDGVLCAEDVHRCHEIAAAVSLAVLLLFDRHADPLSTSARPSRDWTRWSAAPPGNSNQAVIKLLGKLGAGSDVVSEGELRRALAAGIAPAKIMFSGVGKTAREMDFALAAGIHCASTSSPSPNWICFPRAPWQQAPSPPCRCASIRCRCQDPQEDRDRKSREQVRHSTPEGARRLSPGSRSPGIKVVIDMHIGSQITELQPFDDAFALLAGLVEELRADGHAISMSISAWSWASPTAPTTIRRRFPRATQRSCASVTGGLKVIFEPGRADRRQCRHPGHRGDPSPGRLRQGLHHRRCAMNDLIRPTLYDAFHEVRPVTSIRRPAARIVADVVRAGVQETGEHLALDATWSGR